MLSADFGFNSSEENGGRLLDPTLGGGALLDVGIYPISLASMIFGKPSNVTGLAKLGRTSVDKHNGIVLMYPQGELALLHSSIEVNTFHEASIMGTKGRIKIHSSWWKSNAMTVMRDNHKNDFLECPYAGSGYQYEAAEFMKCLREKRQESEIMSWEETLSVLRTMDTLREQWGLKYPGEVFKGI
jgi:predicted dehydrogenase